MNVQSITTRPPQSHCKPLFLQGGLITGLWLTAAGLIAAIFSQENTKERALFAYMGASGGLIALIFAACLLPKPKQLSYRQLAKTRSGLPA